jgi:hypothetical protein
METKEEGAIHLTAEAHPSLLLKELRRTRRHSLSAVLSDEVPP